MLIKIQPDATVCRYLYTAKSLYMFRILQHPSSGVLKTVTATSGTGHTTGTATSLQLLQLVGFLLTLNNKLSTFEGWLLCDAITLKELLKYHFTYLLYLLSYSP